MHRKGDASGGSGGGERGRAGGGEEGRVEVRSRLRRGPRRGAASFWVTRLLPTAKMGP